MTPRSYASTAVILIVVALLVSAVAHAQPSVATGWSTPFEVADLPGTTGGSLVTGDSAGNVYLVWFANSQGKGEDQVDTVYFRRWDGTEWSPSVDILAGSPEGPWIEVDQLVLDAYGRLVLLWHQDRSLVLSIADPEQANRANGWLSLSQPSPMLTGEPKIIDEFNCRKPRKMRVYGVLPGRRSWHPLGHLEDRSMLKRALRI